MRGYETLRRRRNESFPRQVVLPAYREFSCPEVLLKQFKEGDHRFFYIDTIKAGQTPVHEKRTLSRSIRQFWERDNAWYQK